MAIKYNPSKAVIVAILTAAGALAADFVTQNPGYTALGAIAGLVISSLIEFEQAQA